MDHGTVAWSTRRSTSTSGYTRERTASARGWQTPSPVRAGSRDLIVSGCNAGIGLPAVLWEHLLPAQLPGLCVDGERIG
jgi:hypothetical protein